MCRLLVVSAEKPLVVKPYLENFAYISEHSKDYQGHGWGCAYRDDGGTWEVYRNINPVWEEHFERFPPTRLLVAHARSAFEDRDITVENNMPFFDGRYVYIFNGELRGVKIREEGRIGAEKIFNFIKRFDRGNMPEAMKKAVNIIRKRSRYVRGMNIIMVDREHICLSSFFTEDEEYFTVHYKEGHEILTICSDPFPSEQGWKSIPNDSMRTW
jgi:glutamine amidotransferase